MLVAQVDTHFKTFTIALQTLGVGHNNRIKARARETLEVVFAHRLRVGGP
jgi:hypothetical protein